MKKHNLWHTLVNRFFILFNLTKTYERPSKDETSTLHTIKAIVLPDKETVMFDEFSGYTKTKIKIQEVYKGNLSSDTVIEICEPYYEGYYRGKKSLIVYESYEPLVVGKTYIFSLTKAKEEKADPIDKSLVVKIPNENLSKEEVFYYKEVYHKAS